MRVVSGEENLRVYNEPAVAAHYGALDYLTVCELLLFEKYIPRGAAILDLGVGGGRTTPYLSGIASRYLGLDYSEEMIRTCRRKFPELEFQVADASDLSRLDDSCFGAVVFAFNGLDYVIPDARRKRCLRECFRILKPNGVLIFSSHNPRAILVRPGWSRERLHEFAHRLAGEAGANVAARLLTPIKSLHAWARAALASATRVGSRLHTAAFWRGEGYALDRSHGGLLTHYWVPRCAVDELRQTGFRRLACMGDDYPRTSHMFTTDWYYYVFSKDDIVGETSCA
jgi:ubiquinone/menaquinone biosynthesis C-methylase UbiE